MTRAEALSLLLDTRRDPANQMIDWSVCMLCNADIMAGRKSYMRGEGGAAHVDCLTAEIDRMVGVEDAR